MGSRGPVASWVRGVLHPEAYHGGRRTAGHFEGWYIKLVDAERGQRWAIIPGIFRADRQHRDRGPDEAFIQVLDGSPDAAGTPGATTYLPYPLADFEAADDRFDVRIGPNHFDASGFTLDLPDGLPSGRVDVVGPLHPWPVSWRSPGIMGPYGWVPTMECYHGVIGFDHGLRGSLRIGGVDRDFTGGRGYLETDWGSAFPRAYIWLQTNHFDASPGTSLIGSVAVVPWRRAAFAGCIVGLWHQGRLRHFTTHGRARTTALAVDDSTVTWSLRDRHGWTLDLTATRARGGVLHAPVRTQMHRRVEETLDATVLATLRSPDGHCTWSDTGRAAGLEVHGDLELLLRMVRTGR